MKIKVVLHAEGFLDAAAWGMGGGGMTRERAEDSFGLRVKVRKIMAWDAGTVLAEIQGLDSVDWGDLVQSAEWVEDGE